MLLKDSCNCRSWKERSWKSLEFPSNDTKGCYRKIPLKALGHHRSPARVLWPTPSIQTSHSCFSGWYNRCNAGSSTSCRPKLVTSGNIDGPRTLQVSVKLALMKSWAGPRATVLIRLLFVIGQWGLLCCWWGESRWTQRAWQSDTGC